MERRIVFVSVSQQTGLDTRSMTRKLDYSRLKSPPFNGKKGACSVMVIVAENGISYPSSNPGQVSLHFT